MTARPEIRVKRVYDDPDPADGKRILVDRIWPRGMSKDRAAVDFWAKEAAPSTGLRKSFAHDPARWDEFRRRYFAELDANPEAVRALREAIGEGPATLLYAAKREPENNAVALKAYLEGRAR